MTPLSPHAALFVPRQVGIRLRIDERISDVPDDTVQTLTELVSRHGVICIGGQPLTPRQLHDFTGRWGELIQLPGGLAHKNQEPGLPSITRVGNVKADGGIIPSVRFAEYWHHDGDFWAPGENFILNFLSSVRVPPVGGRTGFLDTRRAFDALSDAERTALDGTFVCVRASEIDDFQQASADELPPDVRHPVLLRHPLSQQMALYLPDSSTGIQRRDGSHFSDVNALVDTAQQTLGIVEHAWTEGDLVIVDNLQVMHRSLGGYGDHPRLLYRCQARIRT